MKRLAPRKRSTAGEKEKRKGRGKKLGKSLLPFASPCGFTCLTVYVPAELRSWKREMNARPPLNQPCRWSFISRIVFRTAQFSQLYARPRLCPLQPFQPLPYKCISTLRQKTYNIFEARVSLCYPHRRACNDLRPAAPAPRDNSRTFYSPSRNSDRAERAAASRHRLNTPNTYECRPTPMYIYMRAIPNDFQPSGTVTSKSSRLFAIRLRWRISRRESIDALPAFQRSLHDEKKKSPSEEVTNYQWSKKKDALMIQC